jgi:hypothetical protein
VAGIITPRATCRSCLRSGRAPAGLSAFLRTALLWVGGLAAGSALLWLLTRR